MQQKFYLYNTEDVRKLDSAAIQDYSISGFTLMQNAGTAAFNLLRELWPDTRNITVFAGCGNNAGDGYIVAKLAHEQKMRAVVYQVSSKSLEGDALLAYKAAQESGVKIIKYKNQLVSDEELVVDAMLGIGLNGALKSPWKEVCETINNANSKVLALDIPTGVNGDTGIIHGCAIKADATITFVTKKQGMYTNSAVDYCGDIYIDTLDIPDEIYSQVSPTAELIAPPVCYDKLPEWQLDSHKGNYGHVVVVGGNQGMVGAVIMAGISALRSNAGLVTLATHEKHADLIPLAHPVLMTTSTITKENIVTKADVVLLGPGLGMNAWAEEVFNTVIDIDLPMVVDADGLNLLSRYPKKKDNWVLTPHPGEAAKLLNCDVADIVQDRYAAARSLQQQYGGSVVLKGAGSIVIYNDKVKVCQAGNPGMATAGMGDVLGGIISALVAQNMDMGLATELGVCLHAIAGDKIAQNGTRGILASDMFATIRMVLKDYEENSV